MREIRVAQASIFEKYSEHEFGYRLQAMSDILDAHPEWIDLIADDLIRKDVTATGRLGLSVESVFRCLLLKQHLHIGYEQLAFHLSDSITYRTFARLQSHSMPSRSGLQSVIRRIKPETLEKVHEVLTATLFESEIISLDKVRIDSTVVASHITPPSDSQLLNDGVRVLSRLLIKAKEKTGIKIRFTDQRKKAKSQAFKIFNAKKSVKDRLYPDLIKVSRLVINQADRALQKVTREGAEGKGKQKWIKSVEHYQALLVKVIDQTVRRVIHEEKVKSSEKIVSIFEEHTDIIVKGFRDIQYGHKINLSSDDRGFITCLSIEQGNPADSDLFLPILDFHQSNYNELPKSVVADGGYASQANVREGRKRGVKRVVFHKPVGISLQEMGVKSKTFHQLRRFRAGVEGNISELKRAFGASKATWKKLDGFKAFVWSSVLSYNLVRLARLNTR